MQKSKKYKHTRFSGDVLREAIEVFRRKTNRGEAASWISMSVDNEDAHWQHDSSEEFFADYGKSPREASYVERGSPAELTVHVYGDSVAVSVGAPDRGNIEAVFEVFERHAASSRLPVKELSPDPPTISIGRGTEPTIFYAWQNDTPRHVNRFLVRDLLEGVSKNIGNDAKVEDSPRLDYDTQGISGTPEIASTIFSKIKQCAVFVADVTFVGASPSMAPNGESKLLPNPNVLLELGFASATVGWERIIAVMNERYGPAEEQVFDIKSRRYPIRYTVDPHSRAGLDETKRQLCISLEMAIRLALRSQYEAVEDVIRSLDARSLEMLRDHAGHTLFWRSEDNTVVANMAMDMAYRHLLALRLIHGTWYPERRDYVYGWTYLGLQTLIRLGLRAKP